MSFQICYVEAIKSFYKFIQRIIFFFLETKTQRVVSGELLAILSKTSSVWWNHISLQTNTTPGIHTSTKTIPFFCLWKYILVSQQSAGIAAGKLRIQNLGKRKINDSNVVIEDRREWPWNNLNFGEIYSIK